MAPTDEARMERKGSHIGTIKESFEKLASMNDSKKDRAAMLQKQGSKKRVMGATVSMRKLFFEEWGSKDGKDSKDDSDRAKKTDEQMEKKGKGETDTAVQEKSEEVEDAVQEDAGDITDSIDASKENTLKNNELTQGSEEVAVDDPKAITIASSDRERLNAEISIEEDLKQEKEEDKALYDIPYLPQVVTPYGIGNVLEKAEKQLEVGLPFGTAYIESRQTKPREVMTAYGTGFVAGAKKDMLKVLLAFGTAYIPNGSVEDIDGDDEAVPEEKPVVAERKVQVTVPEEQGTPEQEPQPEVSERPRKEEEKRELKERPWHEEEDLDGETGPAWDSPEEVYKRVPLGLTSKRYVRLFRGRLYYSHDRSELDTLQKVAILECRFSAIEDKTVAAHAKNSSKALKRRIGREKVTVIPLLTIENMQTSEASDEFTLEVSENDKRRKYTFISKKGSNLRKTLHNAILSARYKSA
eukprot:CAMPEP_0184478350 /NCGR_PEP_ID=MMETSP0113_2-20130426/404_1 /TAXON_ID=91329 /ORGANISM="Norrisiella sphaerica, Strain BC52" /LENGTH=467 /DNA_ID=CAMNT_0026856111 /DNA_START=37 /DNA_END=1440 /DNA_ORIENTATION=+